MDPKATLRTASRALEHVRLLREHGRDGVGAGVVLRDLALLVRVRLPAQVQHEARLSGVLAAVLLACKANVTQLVPTRHH